jgi:tRNA threonylcarbamoyladenosine biosynthesis protein TsaE
MAQLTTVVVDLPDEAATGRLARPGDVVALAGALGCGKTTLARAFIRALSGPAEEVPSPTFTLAQSYACPAGTIWHYDLYRLDRPEEALELGIEETFAEAITLIEWPERLGPWLPTERLTVALSPGPGPTDRRAELISGPAWRQRLAGAFK